LKANRALRAAPFCALFLSCAASLTTSVRSDPRADFSKYRTFEIAGARLQTDAEAWLRQEIRARLEAKGLASLERGADLEVIPRLIRDASQSPEPASYVWWSGDQTAAGTTGVPVGSLVVDLVDPSKNQLVWRGEARGTIPSSGALRRDKVRFALDRIFADFPPRRAPG